MTNIEELLEKTGMKVAESYFKKPPQLPYIVFDVDEENLGADNVINIFNRDITVELYSKKIDKEAESKIEEIFKEKLIRFRKSRIWINKDEFLQTIYAFNLLEK